MAVKWKWNNNSVVSKTKEQTKIFVPYERIKKNNNDAFWDKFNAPVYRIPSMVITDNGRIVVVCDYRSTARDQVAIVPVVAISDDNGKTFRKKLLYEANQIPEPSWKNANFRTMDPTMFYYKGKIHIIFGRWNGTKNNGNWTQTQNDDTWGVLHAISNDNGETWELNWNFQNSVSGFPQGASWLGGVGNAIITKFGTCVVPVQFSPQAGKVSASFIYSNDGNTWTKFSGNADGISENSLFQWINFSKNAEITMIGRKDPNTGNNKYGGVVIQTGPTTFQNNSWQTFATFNGKIPARGSSGCQGSAISNSNENGNFGDVPYVLVSYAANYMSNIGAYIRDHITLAAFTRGEATQNNSMKLTDLSIINENPGSFVDGIPYGGYSIIAVNWNCNKRGIVYEDMLGISYKDLSYLIPQMKGE